MDEYVEYFLDKLVSLHAGKLDHQDLFAECRNTCKGLLEVVGLGWRDFPSKSEADSKLGSIAKASARMNKGT